MDDETQRSDGQRIEKLERQVTRLRVGLGTVVAVLLGLGVTAGGPPSGEGSPADRPADVEDVLRAHRVEVVDSTGQERIVLGAPVGTPGRRAAVKELLGEE